MLSTRSMSEDALIRLENLKRLKLDASALSNKVGSRTSYWHDLLAGKKSFGEKVARKIEEKLSLSRLSLDSANHHQPQSNQAHVATESDSLKQILVWEHPDELPEGEYVFVPRLNVQLSTGHGREQIDVDLIKDKPQAFRADWIRELRLKPAGLASMRVTGDSMEPRLYSGDAVVVDTADTEVLDGKAYALWYDGGERIKRLFRLPGGGVRIVSDNRDKYPSIDLSADQCQHVRIIGRVRHVASTRGL